MVFQTPTCPGLSFPNTQHRGNTPSESLSDACDVKIMSQSRGIRKDTLCSTQESCFYYSYTLPCSDISQCTNLCAMRRTRSRRTWNRTNLSDIGDNTNLDTSSYITSHFLILLQTFVIVHQFECEFLEFLQFDEITTYNMISVTFCDIRTRATLVWHLFNTALIRYRMRTENIKIFGYVLYFYWICTKTL